MRRGHRLSAAHVASLMPCDRTRFIFWNCALLCGCAEKQPHSFSQCEDVLPRDSFSLTLHRPFLPARCDCCYNQSLGPERLRCSFPSRVIQVRFAMLRQHVLRMLQRSSRLFHRSTFSLQCPRLRRFNRGECAPGLRLCALCGLGRGRVQQRISIRRVCDD